MCQLTYCDLRDKELNSLMAYFLAYEGSTRHDDGCGFIFQDSIWKSSMQAKKISNLGEIMFDRITDDSPLPFHIRSATYGIEVNDENAHPFMGEHFILMHNGTLLPRSGEEPKDKKKDSDSLRFLKELDQAKNSHPKASFQELINTAMENFAGKFAFIIRDRKTKTDYIVRGRTAELWFSEVKKDGKEIGFVVNTSDTTMNEAFHNWSNSASIVKGGEFDWSKPALLKAETIFKVTSKGLVNIGEIKEVTPVKKVEEPKYLPRPREDHSRGFSGVSDTKPTVGVELQRILTLSEKIYDFLSDHSLGLLDLQIIFNEMDQTSLLEVSRDDLNFFVKEMITKLSTSKNLRKQVAGILNGRSFPIEIYFQFNLEYPWTLNSAQDVLNSLKKYYEIKSK